MKYFKPLSVTWWSGLVPISAGTFIAFAPVHGLPELAAAVNAVFGDMPPGVLINSGLAIIGMRAAL